MIEPLTFTHIFQNGNPLKITVFREKGKRPRLACSRKVTPSECEEYLRFRLSMVDTLQKILTLEELLLLAAK